MGRNRLELCQGIILSKITCINALLTNTAQMIPPPNLDVLELGEFWHIIRLDHTKDGRDDVHRSVSHSPQLIDACVSTLVKGQQVLNDVVKGQ